MAYEKWVEEVRTELDALCTRIGARLGASVSWSAAQVTGKPIEPKFTIKAGLGHFVEKNGLTTAVQDARARSKRQGAVALIRDMWEVCRDAHPGLWSYEQWCADSVKAVDSRALPNDDFADRMRRKRDGRRTQAAETPDSIPGEAAYITSRRPDRVTGAVEKDAKATVFGEQHTDVYPERPVHPVED